MQNFDYIDLHVAGEPFRLITAGFPEICGSTMEEKRRYAIAHLDSVRKLVLLEPRGHADMYGGFLTPPVNSGSAAGVVFIHGSGMSTMCGHGVIALARAAVELGMVPLQGEKTSVRIDTPSGTVELAINASAGKIQRVSFRNDLCFPCAIAQHIRTETYGAVAVDVGYGGAFMVFADVQQFGLTLCSDNIADMLAIAMECGAAAIAQLDMVHPVNPQRNAKSDGICMILVEHLPSTSAELRTRTFTVFGRSQFDRSPTGTGTSALAAVLWKKKLLHPGQSFVNIGISGIPFHVFIESCDESIIPTIQSNAYITGRGQIILEDRDPLQEGLLLSTAPKTEI